MKRWQITNLLLFNDSPMLWFYLQRKDSDLERKTEQQVCEEFLETKFVRNTSKLRNYLLSPEGKYAPGGQPVKYSADNTITDVARTVYNAVDPNLKMKDVFHKCNLKTDFYETNCIRIKLCTSGYPHLLAIH